MFWERFCQLCERSSSKPNPVAESIGVPSGTVTAWKNGRLPRLDVLVRIADYFCVSVDYLIGRSDDDGTNRVGESAELSDEELDLLEFYRGMSRFDRRELLVSAKRMYDAERGSGSEKAF